jgi:hypothetical protein
VNPLIAEAGVAFGFLLMMFLVIMVMILGTFGLIFKVIWGTLRWLFGGVSQPGGERGCGGWRGAEQGRGGERGCGPAWRPVGHGPGVRVCRNAQCQQANPPMAVYCARCGKRL